MTCAPDTSCKDTITIPRDLWAQVYWCLQTYGYAGNWQPYQHAKHGLQEPAINYIGCGVAKRMLDLIPPELFEATLTADAVSGD